MRRVRVHAAAAEEAVLDLLVDEIVPLVAIPGISETQGVKRLLLRRFPYAVVVIEHPAETIVIAFAHTARRPGYWRRRIK